jgi:hypothetical protein
MILESIRRVEMVKSKGAKRALVQRCVDDAPDLLEHLHLEEGGSRR